MHLGPNEGIEDELLGATARKGLVAVAALKLLDGHMWGMTLDQRNPYEP